MITTTQAAKVRAERDRKESAIEAARARCTDPDIYIDRRPVVTFEKDCVLVQVWVRVQDGGK